MNAEAEFEVLANNAVSLQKQGKLAEAIAHYQKALKIAEHPVVLSNLGNALRRAGKLDEAISCQRRAVAIDPRNGWFLANLALAQRAAGESYRSTLIRILDEDLAETGIKMWAALTLDRPQEAFSYRPKKLNVMDYAQLGGLYRQAGLPTLLAALPPLQGTMPGLGSRPIIAAAADGRYAQQFAEDFIGSALAKCPGCDVHLHVMNPGPYSVAKALACVHDGRVTLSVEEMAPDKTLYSTRRFLRLPQFLAHAQRPVIWLDVDSIVNGDILAALPEQYDVALYERPDDPFINQMVNAGFLAITPGGKDFADFLAAYILHFENGTGAQWFVDQMGIVAAWAWLRRNVANLSINSVSTRMMDWTGTRDPQCLIWHAKGDLKAGDG